MRTANRSWRSMRRLLSAVAALTALTMTGETAVPAATAVPGSGDSQAAEWSAKELVFQYQSVTTRYTCDGLQSKMKRLLLKLGARDDLQVIPYGCIQLRDPDPSAGVKIKMNVLQPAASGAAQSVPATWKSVDLLARRDPLDAAADCELIYQIQQKVLPLFTTRNVDYSAACAARQVVIGSTRLKLEVLAPAAAVPAAH